jgi:hypothetical protein
MTIPESQLDIWAKQGSVTQSKDTYATIRRALEASNAAYKQKGYDIFLQGSYGNDTNIYAESDVDVVIRISSYFYELNDLAPDERAAFQRSFVPEAYTYEEYKADVQAALVRSFGSSVQPGGKAIAVEASGNRRKADVIVAEEFRNYYSSPGYSPYSSVYLGSSSPRYHEGICFLTSSGQRIINYPKQHSANCTTKHQATGDRYKPVVRIVKNLRNRLVATGALQAGVAPSYFLEGLFYNVPNAKFSWSYATTLVESMNWILGASRDELLCANERYYLVRDYEHNCWPVANYNQFMSALVRGWNDWG